MPTTFNITSFSRVGSAWRFHGDSFLVIVVFCHSHYWLYYLVGPTCWWQCIFFMIANCCPTCHLFFSALRINAMDKHCRDFIDPLHFCYHSLQLTNLTGWKLLVDLDKHYWQLTPRKSLLLLIYVRGKEHFITALAECPRVCWLHQVLSVRSVLNTRASSGLVHIAEKIQKAFVFWCAMHVAARVARKIK